MDEGANQKKRVLVVDDEPGIGRVLSVMLRLRGYEVVTTTSGAEAIELVRTQQPDIMLLDILMPDVTGMDVLDRVREFSQVPIVIFSANSDVIRLAMRVGANDSIAKPFDPDQVVKKIEAALTSASQKREEV